MANVPIPSEMPKFPFPASVLTFHTQGGSAASPTAPQFARIMQGVAGAGVPPGQKCPSGHCTGVALVDPARHPNPGAALQAPLHVAAVRPVALP